MEPIRHRVGRPRSLDHVKCREVAALVSAGCGLESAARYVGCSVWTVRREMLRNLEFKEEIRVAELKAQLDPLQAMKNAATTHWRAAAWLLERIQPQRFGRHRGAASKPDDLAQALEAAVEAATDEIADPKLRRRICKNLLKAAAESTPALAPSRKSAKPAPCGDEGLRQFIADLDAGRRRNLRQLASVMKVQNRSASTSPRNVQFLDKPTDLSA